jgi:hypothetical protein
MTSQRQEILEACESGDVAALQRLFDTNNIQKSDPVYKDSALDPPPVNSMLAAAITYGHVNAVSLILRTYSGRKIQFTNSTIEALLIHPNLEILQLLYDYDPLVVSFEFRTHIDTFVTKACEQPPEQITPLLLWLIDHDADLEGLRCSRTLCCAILGGQRLGVIEAMVNKSASVSTLAMRQAVVCERIDVIKFFVGRGVEVDADAVKKLRSEKRFVVS